VRSNEDYKIGFVGIENRICVALSRARIGLYVFGDFDCIYNSAIERKNLKFWVDIINLAKEKQVIRNEIKAVCGSHKEGTIIRRPDDFFEFRKGGCNRKCKAKLECGHLW